MASEPASSPATGPDATVAPARAVGHARSGNATDASERLADLLAEHGAYPVRQVRPWTRTALRMALWGSVVLGAVGGVVGLYSLRGGSGGEATADPVVSVNDPVVPAPVGSMAELVAEEWLAASEVDRDRVAELFVEPPALAPAGGSDWRQVVQARTVAAEQVTEGYWAVTVRVGLIEWAGGGDGHAGEEGAGDPDGVGAEAGDLQHAESDLPAGGGVDLLTWYVEVGIVGEADAALAALRTPAVLPGPPEVAAGWSSQAADAREVSSLDPTAGRLEDFLSAALAGDGDVADFLSPEADTTVVTAADPPLFAELQVTDLVVEDESGSTLRAQVFVEAVTQAGSVQPAAYEVVAERRGDRLEVVEFWGTASLRGRPQAGEDTRLDDPTPGAFDLDLEDLDLTDPAGGDGTTEEAVP